MKLTVAYSPCPNDTFMFHALASGRVALPGFEIETHLHDVETLNRLALATTFDITKVSFYVWLRLRQTYSLLQSGAALGFGCGPIVVARQPIDRRDWPGTTIAVPGELTTAHLLLRLWAPEMERRVFVPYDRIIPMVAGGEVQAGVIIHESRFVFASAGLVPVQDLGAWWEGETGLPIPLGCVIARQSLGAATILAFERGLRQSVANALAAPEATAEYVRRYAQELDEDVLRQHIQTFVNPFSLDLGPAGLAAVARLESMARTRGILP